MNVIGDIGGNFLTLKALVEKMPQAELTCLGDPNDRGPRSREVIEFLMNNGRTVQSNHAHMMTEAWQHSATPHMQPRYYDKDIWPGQNGGMATVRSYAPPDWYGIIGSKLHELIDEEHIRFLKSCPMYIETDKFIFSHAPCRQNGTLQEMAELGTGFAGKFSVDYLSEHGLIWNRFVPKRPNPELNGKSLWS